MIRLAGSGTRQLCLVLLGLGLFVRALVPVGWMPVADTQGLRLTLCSGKAKPSAPASSGSEHHEMGASGRYSEHGGSPHAGHGAKGKHEPVKKADHSAPCTFAASALTVPLPPTPAIIAFVSAPTSLGFVFFLVRVGQGLAAPPPPSTGPPNQS